MGQVAKCRYAVSLEQTIAEVASIFGTDWIQVCVRVFEGGREGGRGGGREGGREGGCEREGEGGVEGRREGERIIPCATAHTCVTICDPPT
jgi:hypothetical protein